MNTPPERQIRAFYTEEFIRVYQAYSDEIADCAIETGTFTSPPFSMTRMTWIKLSFLWMMYRSGWGLKDVRQKRILAIDISHEGFKEILSQGVLSTYNNLEKRIQDHDVVIQWDPERDISLQKLNYRTIQIGIRNKVLEKYTNIWIRNISDITNSVHEIHNLLTTGKYETALALLPIEKSYIYQPFSTEIVK
ncbi:DUF4291 domain-containing protein [Mangrovibacter yixingensis]|uniref:DUF4291 domain-containing protein n=1 Tax=Mangrovibacter yixingensis TaxID=1529639 RepID=UPI001CFE5B00|nr:DUF4291 domain-containing protein [Mangrovibacter yixingensis]